jgi:hypothetical protein
MGTAALVDELSMSTAIDAAVAVVGWQHAYFGSNRAGGEGDADHYVTTRPTHAA